MKKNTVKDTLQLLLSGRHPKAKKYAGYHVLVVENEIVPLREGSLGLEDIERMEKKYDKTPTVVFVPRHDISYIL